MKKIKQTLILIISITALSFFIACGSSESEGAEASKRLDSLSSIALKEQPKETVALGILKASAKPGDDVVVSGQIGGKLKPFIDGYAGFVLGDEDIMFCDEMGDKDHCKTPWDACCEDKDKLKANRATVQFVDAEGTPIIGGLKGVEGLSELEKVIVVGKVAPHSSDSNLVINATGLYRGDLESK